MPAWTKLSAYLQAHQNEGTSDKIPSQLGLTGDMDYWEYIGRPEHNDLLSYAGRFMQNWKEGTPDWLSVYPIKDTGKDLDPERVLFVDVGGGLGHQFQLLLQQKSELKGRIVLEDLPEVVKGRPPIDGVEFLSQDFREEQKIKGKPRRRLLDPGLGLMCA